MKTLLKIAFAFSAVICSTSAGPNDPPDPRQCTDPNEVYYGCKPCKYTCESLDISCASWCISGCECKEGYVRKNDNDDTCVPRDTCPTCSEGEEYQSCGSACPTNCDNINGPQARCGTVCVEGCFCQEGLVRNKQTGLCVLPEDCPPKCPLYEEYVQCGTPCPLTCKNKDNPPNPKDCPKKCVPGCFCIKGYVRNTDTGKCVLPKDCPLIKSCKDPNAEYLTCKRCVGSCDDNNPICDGSCNPPGCYCKKGYIKTSKTNPTCILSTDCPKSCKNKNEVWLTNCPILQNTCEISYKPTTPTKPGCCCKPGFVREYQGGPCISTSLC